MMISGWFLWDWVIAVEVIVAAFYLGIEDGELFSTQLINPSA